MTPPAHRTARALARQTLTAEILDAARRQLAELGPGQLSLRAISRELGMTSSAIYRYFASRDELLTVLLVESYTALGDIAERAALGAGTAGERFVATCRSVRAWAKERPHEWSLLYGSPVPGYRAPEQTVDPASRMPLALLRLAEQGLRDGQLTPPQAPEALAPELSAQVAAMAKAMGGDLPDWLGVRMGGAWTQLMGTISAELYGHLVGTFDPSDDFAEYVWAATARRVGFSDPAAG
ncbi:TetR/AcrR family transcriptional regulator [Nakamurella lactea]|uniref:TetR/AcrR family transcriptional regulator n=1 Tax=Nakamurella lactea TaxID=459515 RepID=UPI00041EDA2F|nr:TetR/AcrR family transcriptional regulator [Nakamurella lactea]